MIVAIQSHFNGPIGLELCKQIVEMKFGLFRISIFNNTSHQAAQEAMIECLDAGGDFLLTTNDEELIKKTSRIKVECDNEPDHRIPIKEYYDKFIRFYNICKENNNQLYGPCISNTDQDSIDWLNEFMRMGVPDDVIISYHSYRPKNDVESHHRGFSSRDGEMKWLKAAAGHRKLAHTEGGYSLPDEHKQAEMIKYEMDFAARHGITMWTYYQIWQATDDFGLMRNDRSFKEPLVEMFRNYTPCQSEN